MKQEINKRSFFKYLKNTENENLEIKINLLNGKIEQKRKISNEFSNLIYTDYINLSNNLNDYYINEIIISKFNELNEANIEEEVEDNFPLEIKLKDNFQGKISVDYLINTYFVNIEDYRLDIERSIIEDDAIDKEFLFFIREELQISKKEMNIKQIQKQFKNMEKEILKGEKMIYEKGFIKILPTRKQFEQAKSDKNFDLNKLKNENKIEELDSKNGKFKTCRIKINSLKNDEYEESEIIQVSRNIDKVLFYANEKIPVNAILREEVNKTEKGEYVSLRLVGLEDGRSIKNLEHLQKLKNVEEHNEEERED